MRIRRDLLRIGGNVLCAAALIVLVLKLARNVTTLESIRISAASLSAVVGACVFYLISAILGAQAWRILIRGGEVHLPLIEAYALVGKAQIAKYLPGNIFQYVGRVTLGSERGISAEATMLSMGLETAIVAVTAMLISAVGFAIVDVRLDWLNQIFSHRWYIPTVIFGLVIISSLGVAARHRTEIIDWVKERRSYLRPDRIFGTMLIYGSVLVLSGLIVDWLLKALWNTDSSLPWYQLSWGFSLSWLVGFIVPGAPGGIGIREAVFVGLFQSQLGEGLAVTLAALLRIITGVSDIATFGIAQIISSRLQPPAR